MQCFSCCTCRCIRVELIHVRVLNRRCTRSILITLIITTGMSNNIALRSVCYYIQCIWMTQVLYDDNVMNTDDTVFTHLNVFKPHNVIATCSVIILNTPVVESRGSNLCWNTERGKTLCEKMHVLLKPTSPLTVTIRTCTVQLVSFTPYMVLACKIVNHLTSCTKGMVMVCIPYLEVFLYATNSSPLNFHSTNLNK